MMKIRMGYGTLVCGGLFLLGGAVALWTGRIGVSALVSSLRFLFPIAVAIAVHEAGHMLAAGFVGVRLGGLRISLFGARLGLRGVISYRRECIIAAAGPLANLLSAAAVFLLYSGDSESTLGEAVAAHLASGEASATFALASLGLAFLNLLPVRTLDGGRILRCVVAPIGGIHAAECVVRAGSALCLGGMWCFSVYALLRAGEMLGLFGFSLCLLLRMMGDEG